MMPFSSSVEQNQKVIDNGDYSSSANEGRDWKNVKKRKDEEKEECEEIQESSSSSKKPRVVWSAELHQQFVSAVNQLGIEAVPRKILELMNVPGLSRQNVASHLQKYRLYLMRLNGSQHMGSMYGSFMDSPEVGDRPLSTVNGFDLQTMTSASQLPGRTLATLPAAIVGYSNNIFSFENQKMQYGQNEHHPLAAILQEGYNERYGVDETLDAQSGSMSNTYPRWADHVGLTNGDYDGFGSAVDGFMLQGNNLEENFNTAYNEDFFPVQETAEQHELHQDSIRDELGSLKHAQEAQASKIDELLESQASYKQNLKKVVAQEVSNVVRQEVGNIVALEIAKANRQLLEDIRKPP